NTYTWFAPALSVSRTMIPICAALLPCTLTTRATIVPSPASGWYTKWNPSEAVIIVPCPAPATVNVPFAKLALPATPTEPMSPSDQTVGRGWSTAVTVRLTVVVVAPTKPADEPVTVTATVPVAALLLAVSVSILVLVTVLVPGGAVLLAVNVNVLVLVVLLGLNEAVTPLGRPDADKLTLPLKPFCGVTVMVLAPLPPCVTVTLLGEVKSEKLGAGGPG